MDPEDLIPVSNSLGRAFMATHGLTSTDTHLLALESVVGPALQARRDRERITFERRDILERTTDTPLSIPELAVFCSLPLLASQLIVSQMVSEGLLTVVAAAAEDELDIDLRSLQLIRAKIKGL